MSASSDELCPDTYQSHACVSAPLFLAHKLAHKHSSNVPHVGYRPGSVIPRHPSTHSGQFLNGYICTL